MAFIMPKPTAPHNYWKCKPTFCAF